MIEELGIRDLGVIAEATLPLGSGFTAVTGETGAGKTMVVTALGLLLGARADAGAVRSGAKQAWVEGRWLVPDDGAIADRVAETGGEVEAGELLLGRSVSSEGRSRAIVGGRSAPVGVLGELGDELVVVHGQADQQRLRSAAAQREALDRFAGPALHDALEAYRAAFRPGGPTLPNSRAFVRRTMREPARPRSCAQALDEVEAADPQPGEDAELAERADRLSNLEDLRVAAAQARALVSADEVVDDAPDASPSSRRHGGTSTSVVGHDPALAPIAEALTNAGFLLADAAAELAGYLAGLDADGARELEIVQERRAVLAALVRRHGGSLDDVLDFRRDRRAAAGRARRRRRAHRRTRGRGRRTRVRGRSTRDSTHRASHRGCRAARRRGDTRARGPGDARRAPQRQRRARTTSRLRTGAIRSRSCCDRTPAPSPGRSRAARRAVSSPG